jgi:hypothetical protein
MTEAMGGLIIGSVVVDDRDYLNVLWFDQGLTRNLFLSQAHTSFAENAQAWKTQVLERPALAMSGPDLVTQPGGRLYVVYALDQTAVVLQATEDYGASWPVYTTIWQVPNAKQEAVANPRITIDGKGNLHAIWTVNTAERDWMGEAVYYAGSTDGGDTWEVQEVSRSLPDEETTAWIGIAVRAGDEIHLAWNRGIGSRLGRYHSWSPDNGQTWSEPDPFLPELVSGQTQWPLMVEDSSGTLHLITIAGGPPFVEGEGDDTRPRYAYWNGSVWSQMYTFPESCGDFAAALVIGLGNQLHLIHERERYQGQLVYSTRRVDAPRIAPQQIPNPGILAASRLPTPMLVPTPGETPVPVVQAWDLEPPPPEVSSTGAQLTSLLLPIVLVLALLALVLIWRLRRGHLG